ncbi:hypothetical protein LTR84_001467 [Exophiala bonariae]|uniref:Cyanovirin-N domain-containing protein n=1 Tax=Exophiala bonariae TaxID=1690606 RepID=A0AAV9NCS6_9EURO|nr:hypothetical protein LTR84_001467 [Exophiala bonariae]
MISLSSIFRVAALVSLTTATSITRRQTSGGAIAQALLCSDDNLSNICQAFFLSDGQTQNFPDLNREIGISSIGVVPEGGDRFNRQNARCIFRSSILGGELCVSSGDSVDEATLSENALNDVIDSVQCFVGRCPGDL